MLQQLPLSHPQQLHAMQPQQRFVRGSAFEKIYNNALITEGRR